MTRRWLVAGAVVFASAGGAGCTDPVVIEANTCGNLVQEAGEDCDRPDGLCTAICHFACSVEAATTCADADGAPALDGSCCPSGSSCGADGSCRWPAGTFAGVATAPYGMYQYEAADLDGDHIDDLLGVSAGNVVAAYGAFETPFATHLTRAGVSATSAAIGDFVGDVAGEGDGRPDVAFTSQRAIYVLDTRTGAPEPYAFAHRYQDDRLFLRSSQAALVSVLLGARQDQAELEWELPADRGSTRPCDLAAPVSRVAGTGLHPFPITNQLAVVPVLLLPRDQAQCVGGQPSACAQICIQALPPTPAAPSIVIPLPEDPGDGEIFFGEVDGNDCGDLVFPSITDTKPTTRVWLGVRGPDLKCGFVGSPVVTVSGAPLGTVLEGGGRHWLATSTGVYGLGGGVLKLVLEAPLAGWTQVAEGDFDGDGALDFAARSGGVPEIEVYQRRFVTQGPEQWRLQRIPTIGGTLVKLDVGDFDANGFDDVALAAIDSFSSYQAQISVAYSNGQTFSPPTSIATVVGFRDLAAAGLPDPSLDPTLDVFDDLTVLHDTGTAGTITRLYGGGDRVMTSPWRAMVTEALAISLVDDESLVTIAFDKGRARVDARRLVLGERGFTEVGPRGDAILTFQFNTFARLPQASGPDVVFAMTNTDPDVDDAAPPCATIMDPASLQTRGVPCSTLLPNAPASQLRGVERLTVVPGDPLRLHVLRHDSERADVVYNELYDVDVTGADPVLSNYVHLEPAIDEQLGAERFRIYCAPFTSIELGGRGTGREIAIACTHVDGRLMDIRTTVFLRFTRDGEPPQWDRLEIEELSAELRTGDVNGDGLEDLLVSGSSNVTTAFLQRECDAGTEGCR